MAESDLELMHDVLFLNLHALYLTSRLGRYQRELSGPSA